MSGSNRSVVAKTGLTLAATAAALSFGLWVIGSGLSRDAEYQRQADQRSGEYAAYTQQQIRQDCFPLVGINQANCIAKKRHEYREDRRDERDLVAQRKSANWAYIMGAAAVLGMVLSAVGVYLVWTTFAETRRANEIAREGQRAWLYIESIEARQYGVILAGKMQIFTNVILRVKNSGLSSAVDVNRRVTGIATNSFRWELQDTFFKESVRRYYNTVENVAPGATIELSFMVDRHEMVDLAQGDGTDTLTTISISLVYSDNSPVRRQTGQSYYTCKAILEADGTQAFPIDELAVPLVAPGKPMGRLCALRPVEGAVMS